MSWSNRAQVILGVVLPLISATLQEWKISDCLISDNNFRIKKLGTHFGQNQEKFWTYCFGSGFPHFFICIYPGVFQNFSRSKLRFFRTVVCFRGIKIMPKTFNPNFICIFSKLQDFFQDIFIPFFFPGMGMYFSFSRFSRVRGNPAVWKHVKFQRIWSVKDHILIGK